MLSKLLVNIYATLIEIGLWLLLIVGLIGGWQAGGLLGAIGGLIVAAVFGAIFFGVFLVLIDIRDRVKSIEQQKSTET